MRKLKKTLINNTNLSFKKKSKLKKRYKIEENQQLDKIKYKISSNYCLISTYLEHLNMLQYNNSRSIAVKEYTV